MKRLLLLLVVAAWLPLSKLAVTAQPLPVLQITNANGSAAVSWPATNAGLTFFLQSTTNLSSSNSWIDSTVPTGMIGDQTTATLAMTNPQQFFRLKLPIFSFGLGTPVFQFAIFYNFDLEISPDAPMNVNGRVLCEGNIWASPDGPLTFQSNVMCTKVFFRIRNPNDPLPNGTGPVLFNIPGNPLTNVSSEIGMVGYFPAVGATMFAISNPTNLVRAMLDPPPTGEDPNSAAGQERFYNFADLVVTNSSNGVISVFFQDTNNAARLTPIPYDSQAISTEMETNYTIDCEANVTVHNGHYTTNINCNTTATNIVTIETTNYVYSFVSNTTFYDFREGKAVQAVQIDVGNLLTWITNDTPSGGSSYNFQNLSDKGHGIDSVYVYSGVPLTGTQLPAVRLVNGQQLQPFGLTIATPMPLYVLGNYNVQTPGGTSIGANNTVYTCPAAFMADAVTVLSSNWSDSYNGSTDLAQRPAADATVNAAILQGIVPSITVSGVKHYSCGAENFLRLLEDWSTNTLTYNGSMIAMFNCRYATNYWQSPGNYYNEPSWQWSFDANFLNQNLLPPGTPNVVP
jgi:hypothetical protein